MRLTAFTDYTLRTLLDLASRPGELATIADIAARNGMSKCHLNKVVHALGLTGVVRTVRGRSGGIMLARAPAAICIGAVVRASEPNFHMAACFDARRERCPYDNGCGLQGVLARASDAFLASLDKVTLADLAGGPSHFGLGR